MCDYADANGCMDCYGGCIDNTKQAIYVARDEDMTLLLFIGEEPMKREHHWASLFGQSAVLSQGLFPEVQWQDSEPTEVELVIKRRD